MPDITGWYREPDADVVPVEKTMKPVVFESIDGLVLKSSGLYFRNIRIGEHDYFPKGKEFDEWRQKYPGGHVHVRFNDVFSDKVIKKHHDLFMKVVQTINDTNQYLAHWAVPKVRPQGFVCLAHG